MVSRTHSAPAPFMRSRMLLSNLVDDDDNESAIHKIDSGCFNTVTSDLNSHPRLVLRTHSHSSAGSNSNSVEKILGTSSSPSKSGFAKADKQSSTTKQQQQLPIAAASAKRRKPRMQSGEAVKDIRNRQDFRQFVASHNHGSFPVLIRDQSFRVIRRRTLERRLVRLPHYRAAAA